MRVGKEREMGCTMRECVVVLIVHPTDQIRHTC